MSKYNQLLLESFRTIVIGTGDSGAALDTPNIGSVKHSIYRVDDYQRCGKCSGANTWGW